MDPLATAEELSDYAEEDVPAPQAALHLASASAIVRSFCRWRIDYSGDLGEEVTLDGMARSLLPLPTLHLIDVLSVTLNGDELDSTTGYSWTSGGLLVRDAGWGCYARGVVATIVHGYEENPADVKAVVLGLAYRYYENPASHGSEALGGDPVGYAGGVLNVGGLTTSDRDILSRHRLP